MTLLYLVPWVTTRKWLKYFTVTAKFQQSDKYDLDVKLARI
jgi:hypothetical protein